MAVPALAEAPSPSASERPADTPPIGIWRPTADGGYEHRLTGLRCPIKLGAYRRRRVEIFDRFGLDVGCDYGGPYAGVTYYLTHREGTGLQEAMSEAKRELENANASLNPKLVSETHAEDGGFDWTIATYDRDGGMREAIWLADLSGWTIEYRITYHAAEERNVSASVSTLASEVRANVGARLLTCAKAKPARRDGKAVTDLHDVQSASMMSSILGGALASMAVEEKLPATSAPVLCFERAGVYGGYALVFDRSLGSDGSDALSDVVTVAAAGAPTTVRFEGSGLAGLLVDKPGQPRQWTAVFDRDDQSLIFGYFNGRPTIDQMGELVARMLTGEAKPVGGYSAKGKTISVMMPPK